ncbi:uncharacterized protein LOC144430650 [Styela clava]
MASNASNTLQAMNRIRQNDELCDFALQVGSRTVRVHRLVLSSCSDYFRRMFATDMIETKKNICVVKGFEFEDVQQCVGFMYGEDFKFDMSNIEGIFKLCDLWLLEKAKNECTKYLLRNLSQDCIDVNILASKYNLNDVRRECHKHTIKNMTELMKYNENLPIVDVIEIMKLGGIECVSAIDLWNFATHWMDKQTTSSLESTCHIIKYFPVNIFDVAGFQEHIWKYKHVETCHECRSFVSNTFMDSLGTVFSRHVNLENCLFLKKISKSFQRRSLEIWIDEYIIRQHEGVFKSPAFIEVAKDDLLKLAENIDEECSKSHFSCLVSWLKNHPECHMEVFPQLFENPQDSDKLFLYSLKKFEKGNKDQSFFSRFYSFFVDYWLLNTDNCIYMKNISQKCQCRNAEAKIDEYVIENFREVSKSDDFCDIDEPSMEKYLKTQKNYRSSEVVWEAVKRWVEFDLDERKKHFVTLFSALKLNKFSTVFLREFVCKYHLVNESIICTNKLIEVLFKRFEKQQEEIDLIKKRLTSLEKKK